MEHHLAARMRLARTLMVRLHALAMSDTLALVSLVLMWMSADSSHTIVKLVQLAPTLLVRSHALAISDTLALALGVMMWMNVD